MFLSGIRLKMQMRLHQRKQCKQWPVLLSIPGEIANLTDNLSSSATRCSDNQSLIHRLLACSHSSQFRHAEQLLSSSSTGNESPNIGFPLLDCSLVASS